MKNTKQKLVLSQETLRILVHEKPVKSGGASISTVPMCPNSGPICGGPLD